MHGRVMERGDQVSCQENTKGLHGMTSSAAVFKVGHTTITTSQLQLFSFRVKQVLKNTVARLGLSAILTYGRHGDGGIWYSYSYSIWTCSSTALNNKGPE
jgi:hypothetical protein